MPRVFTGSIKLGVPADIRRLPQSIVHHLLDEVVDKFETLHQDHVTLDPPSTDGLVFPVVATDPEPQVIARYGLVEVADAIKPFGDSK